MKYGYFIGEEFFYAPKTVRLDGMVRATALLSEEEANRAGYLLVVDEPPECEANEVALPTGLEVRDGRI